MQMQIQKAQDLLEGAEDGDVYEFYSKLIHTFIFYYATRAEYCPENDAVRMPWLNIMLLLCSSWLFVFRVMSEVHSCIFTGH